ncbi:golgin subfamily A member 4-like isoform X2 [Thrips palmi]|uniref:Golgin subfamily A member 4-like isoform X2 n=1 Tax=Thrips palmi TaxID=161013 RepID=A0A6P9A1F0_THRPL|nr:golgin subfamily A member 4-like isoform X2 [Thrips palmi]
MSFAKGRRSDLDYDEEDPLADLLSSSGENTPVKTSSRKSSTKETPELPRQQSKSKLIADLFGLNGEDEVKTTSTLPSTTSISKPANKVENAGDWLGLTGDQEDYDLPNENYAPNSRRRLLSKENSKDDDFLSPTLNMRENIKNTSVPKTIASTASDELAKANLPAQRRNSGGMQENKKTSSILSSFISDFDTKPNPPGEPSSKKGNETDVEQWKGVYSMSGSRESRRSTRRRGGDIVDPLGLFSSQQQSAQSNLKDTQNEVEPVSTVPAQAPALSNTGGTSALPISSSSAPSVKTTDTTNDRSPADVKPAAQSDVDILTGLSNLEAQAGEAAAQQQKSLITALALKRQEDALLKLQSQQAALLSQHEQQLGALVQRQLQRQQQMIRQQEQIQAHIQALMVQPPVVAPITLPTMLWNIEESPRHDPDSQVVVESSRFQMEKDLKMISDLKGQVQKLEIENQDLKAQLDIEKQRHENHLSDMDKLFRKQLTSLEEAMSNQEKRHHSEIDAMEKEVSTRVNRLKEDHTKASSEQAQRMAQLHSEWLADLQRLGEFHQQAVEMLKSEQTSAIEHWKMLQMAEIDSVKEAGSNARMLEAAVTHLQESTSSLTELKDHIKKEFQSQYLQKQESLMKQELQLTGLKESLEKQTAALETERSCLSKLSQDLESRLQKQQQEVNDDRCRFEAREKAWEREKLGAIDLLNEEKAHLEKLQSEAHTELAELAERKLVLAADVARLETTLQIQSSHANRNSQQAEQMVAEARSTLEAAQDAAKEVQREREEINELKHNLAFEQKRLSSLEKNIQGREQQLEEEMLRAKAFRQEGISALDEARRLERERTEHASDLAQRLLHLKRREDSLSEEKLALTMEWKKLQESRENTACSHCGQGQLESVAMSSFHHTTHIVDPLPIIMKLEAEQGLDFATLDHPRYHSSLMESVSQ